MAGLYEQDYYAWANEQAALLRAGKLAEADIENIAEEIESMGKGEKREMVSRLTVLLLHLLKWQYQPNLQGASWRTSIVNTRLELIDHLTDNPSLKSQIADVMARAYRRALNEAVMETGLVKETFPPVCPWSYAEAMAEGFWPD